MQMKVFSMWPGEGNLPPRCRFGYVRLRFGIGPGSVQVWFGSARCRLGFEAARSWPGHQKTLKINRKSKIIWKYEMMPSRNSAEKPRANSGPQGPQNYGWPWFCGWDPGWGAPKLWLAMVLGLGSMAGHGFGAGIYGWPWFCGWDPGWDPGWGSGWPWFCGWDPGWGYGWPWFCGWDLRLAMYLWLGSLAGPGSALVLPWLCLGQNWIRTGAELVLIWVELVLPFFLFLIEFQLKLWPHRSEPKCLNLCVIISRPRVLSAKL